MRYRNLWTCLVSAFLIYFTFSSSHVFADEIDDAIFAFFNKIKSETTPKEVIAELNLAIERIHKVNNPDMGRSVSYHFFFQRHVPYRAPDLGEKQKYLRAMLQPKWHIYWEMAIRTLPTQSLKGLLSEFATEDLVQPLTKQLQTAHIHLNYSSLHEILNSLDWKTAWAIWRKKFAMEPTLAMIEFIGAIFPIEEAQGDELAFNEDQLFQIAQKLAALFPEERRAIAPAVLEWWAQVSQLLTGFAGIAIDEFLRTYLPANSAAALPKPEAKSPLGFPIWPQAKRNLQLIKKLSTNQFEVEVELALKKPLTEYQQMAAHALFVGMDEDLIGPVVGYNVLITRSARQKIHASVLERFNREFSLIALEEFRVAILESDRLPLGAESANDKDAKYAQLFSRIPLTYEYWLERAAEVTDSQQFQEFQTDINRLSFALPRRIDDIPEMRKCGVWVKGLSDMSGAE